MVDLRTTEPRSLSFKELRHNVQRLFFCNERNRCQCGRNKMGTWTKFYPGEQEQMMLTHQTKNEPFCLQYQHRQLSYATAKILMIKIAFLFYSCINICREKPLYRISSTINSFFHAKRIITMRSTHFVDDSFPLALDFFTPTRKAKLQRSRRWFQ